MTAVKLVDQYDTEPQFLADVPFHRLHEVIPMLKTWGINGEEPTLSGQFSYSDTGAWFQVTIHEQDEG